MPLMKDQVRAFSGALDESLDDDLIEMLAGLSPDEQEALNFMFMQGQDDPLLYSNHLVADLKGSERDREIVPIDVWLDDPIYMGEMTKNLYPVWRNALIEIFGTKRYAVTVASGSTGTGKSFLSHFIICRMIYEISCLKDPARSLGLASGSPLAFCTIANSKETARRVVFDQIVSKMKESPYFREHFSPVKDNKDELVFPKNIMLIAGSSTDTSIIGMNILGGVFDESNFVRSNTNSVGGQNYSSSQRERNYKKAQQLFTSISRRIKSRFSQSGFNMGMLVVVSSKTTTDSFTERLVQSAVAEGDDSVLIRDYSLVDVKRDQFSKKTFKVLVGNESFPSRVLAPDETEDDAPPDAVVIDVPEDLRREFEMDLDSSLRDLMGISTMALSSFFTRVDMVDGIVDETRSHPFMCPVMPNTSEWDSRLPYRILWERIARRMDSGDWEPIVAPDQPRFVAFDPASTGDAFGLAIGCVSHTVPVGDWEGAEQLPFFHIDFVLRIKGHPGEEVLFKNVRQLVYEFSAHGFHVRKVTTDTYQSREMLQALHDQGYKAEFFSVDTSKEPYRHFRSAVYDRRVGVYRHDVLTSEMKGLEENPMKIDHRPDSSKDLSDAVCALIFNLMLDYQSRRPLLPMKGLSEEAPTPAHKAAQAILDEGLREAPAPTRKVYAKGTKPQPATTRPAAKKQAEPFDPSDLMMLG